MWRKCVALSWLVAAALVGEPAPLVRLRSGLVRGRLAPGARSYHYIGIPYGRVDHTNRFQAPLPPLAWEGEFDAVEENARCPQEMAGGVVLGAADCLRVSVYTPARRPAPLPVMVFLHGGCFFGGTGTGYLYGADDFPQYGVVFVGVNYRLNVEGFLCLGIKEAPGNAGLKDQIAALKWVQENISAFGGDPDSVTLFGESAGAVSASYLMLSPAARGLFHKVILQSGSTLAPWGTQHEPIATAISLVKQLGYDTNDPREIHRILSEKTIEELITGIKYSEHRNFITSETLFAPCIEREIPGVEAVVTKHSIDIIKGGNYTKVPMIIGFNDNEGIYFVGKDYGARIDEIGVADKLQKDLVFPSEVERNRTVERIREQYFEGDSMSGMVDLYSDLHFKVPALLEAELYAGSSEQPIYYYLFRHSGWLNVPKLSTLWFWRWEGASHADELFYLFKPHSFPTPWRPLEALMVRRMLTLWTNFAKYSDPTPQVTRLLPVRWRASRGGGGRGPRALVLGRALSLAPLAQHAAVRLWNDTYRAYRRRRYGFTAKRTHRARP